MSDASGLVTRIHVDTDPGLDDLLALALAFASPELVVCGLSTVAGNTSLENATANARGFLELAGLDLPLGRGAAGPRSLSRVSGESFHGELGRAGIPLPVPPDTELPSARDVLRASIVERQVECIVALGPLTNLAELVRHEPDLLAGVEIVWMGGALEGGNVTPLAEFNCHADPQAAAQVLDSGHAVRIISLDVTSNVRLRARDVGEDPFGKSPLGQFLEATLGAMMDAELVTEGERCALLHDPAAVAALASRDLFRYEPRRVAIDAAEGRDRGRMRVTTDPGPFASWAVEVNSEALLDLFTRRLAAWAGESGWSDETAT